MGVDGNLDIDWEAAQRRADESTALHQQVAADPRTPQRARSISDSTLDAPWMPAGFHVAVAMAGLPRFVTGDLAVRFAAQASGYLNQVPEMDARLQGVAEQMRSSGSYTEQQITEALEREASATFARTAKGVNEQFDAQANADKPKKKNFWNKVGDVAGGGAHLAANVVKPVGRVAAEGVDIVVPEKVEDAFGGGGRAIIRTAASAAEAPAQEVSGFLRNSAAVVQGSAGGAVSGRGGSAVQQLQAANQGVDFSQSQSDFGVALGDLLSGQTSAKEMFLGATRQRPKMNPDGTPVVDAQGQPVMEDYSPSLGTGFLPDKSAGAPMEAAQRARDVLSINGQAWTPGRMTASMLVEPGTAQYNIISGLTDAGVAWWFDPTNRVFDGIAEGRKARDAFELYGLIPGHRYTALTEVADSYLSSRAGIARLEGFAEEGDWTKIWRRFDRQIDPEIAQALAAEDTVDGVRAVLRPHIGTTLASRSEIPNLGTTIDSLGGATLRRWKDDARFLGDVPGRTAYIDDHIGTLKAFDDHMANINMPVEARDRLLADLGTSLRDPSTTTQAAQSIKSVEKAMAAQLEHYGIRSQDAQNMTAIISKSYEDMHRFALDEMGNNIDVGFINIGGTPTQLGSPHLLAEQLARTISFPDAREMKRSASHFNALWTNGLWEGGVDGLQNLQGVWKKWVLLRGAYVVRVIADEQMRMGADGLTSMFDDPASWISYIAGAEDSKLGSMLQHVGVKPRGGGDLLTGRAWNIEEESSAFAQTVGRQARELQRGDKAALRHIKTNDWSLTNFGSDDFPSAWADELARYSRDDVMKRVASGGPLANDAITTPGIDGVKEWLRGQPELREQLGKMFADRGADFADDAVVNGYVDSVVYRWEQMSKSDPTLQSAFATGLLPSGKTAFSGGRPTYELQAHLKDLMDQGVGPAFMKKQGQYSVRVAEQRKAVTDTMFEYLAGKPTRTLSRSPAFRQFYYERMAVLAGAMDDASRNLMLRNAEDILKPRGPEALRRIGDKILGREEDVYDHILRNVQKPAGTLTLKDADQAAKAWALNKTKELLYDTTKKSQWADTARIISPFAEAWKEQITVWSKLLNPTTAQGVANLRRGQQLIQGARGAGFFYPDPTTGKEVFNYPMTGALAQVFTGLNAPMKGQVQGLSLWGNIQPGIGPIMSIPMSKLLPDKPEYDTLAQLIFPYGEPDVSAQGVLEDALMPSWMKNMRTALVSDPQNDRVFGNFVSDVMGTLAAKGGYGNTAAERERLYNDAVPKARILYMLRALGPVVGMPAAPSIDLKAPDAQGLDVSVALMAQDWNKMQEEGYDTAPQRFMDKYGDDAFVFMATKSLSNVGGQKASDAYGDWERTHNGLVEQYPEIAGYFGPDVEGIDFAVYNRQMRQGRREGRDPQERFDAGQSLVAGFIYRARRDSLPDNPSKEQRAWLRQWKDKLLKEYPAWNPEGFTNDRPEAMRQLYAAKDDPGVKDTPVGSALATYLERRDAALEQVKARGLTADQGAFSQAQGAADLRQWLYRWGEKLSAETPEFARMWDQVLASEVDDSEAEAPVPAPAEVAPNG